MTPYEVLGISPGVSDTEINAAYRRACMRTHPDRGGTEAAFQAVKRAYAALQQGPCTECGGSGVVSIKRGFFVDKSPCPKCWKT